MPATSVTGVGQGGAKPSGHATLGVSHLIGPRWTEERERELKWLRVRVTILEVVVTIHFMAFILFAVLR